MKLSQPSRAATGSGASAACARGFTLLELMVTIAIVAVLATVAIPSFRSIINSNRLTGQANELVTSIQLARSEAIRRNISATLCRSTDGNTCAGSTGAWTQWIVVLGDSTNTVLRRAAIRDSGQIGLTASTAALTFRADGLARGTTGALARESFVVCIATSQPAENQRNVTVVGGSRVATTSVNGSGSCPTTPTAP